MFVMLAMRERFGVTNCFSVTMKKMSATPSKQEACMSGKIITAVAAILIGSTAVASAQVWVYPRDRYWGDYAHYGAVYPPGTVMIGVAPYGYYAPGYYYDYAPGYVYRWNSWGMW